MRRIRPNRLANLACLLTLAVLQACSAGIAIDLPDNKLIVGIRAGDVQTRTSMQEDGLSAQWSDGDSLVVWALNSSGSYTLSGKSFHTYGLDFSRGWFTTELTEAMVEDTYTYYACYPAPLSVSGTSASFSLSAEQDGKAGGGNDILIASPAEHGALTAIPEEEDHSGLSMQMNHLLHQFRFYVPDGEDQLEGEAIEKIVLGFPANVVGTVTADFTDPDAALSLSDGASEVTLVLEEPLNASTSTTTEYACVALFPQTFAEGETFSIKTYSASKVGTTDPVDLQGRTFLAGHSTPVKILLTTIGSYCRIKVNLAVNNLGEDLLSVTLTAPEGCKWGDDGSNVFVYEPADTVRVGDTFEISFETEEYYRAFSGQDITVTYDSEHVNTSVTYTMPAMETGYIVTMDLEVPYLLYEDFSTVETFSSNDTYTSGFSTGSKSAYSFLDGWTGGRIGAEEGKCIRIAARRETSARYAARVDSAPIISLKASANLKVEFNYGSDNDYNTIITSGDVGQNVYIGYITTTDALKSGDDTGTFEDANTIYAHEFTGSYDNTPNKDSVVLQNVPTGTVRICWRSNTESNSGITNTTCWFYIDNVKVTIAN